MKVGLVLEGGAMRGTYTAGVLDVFMKNNIEVDEIIGVSAGVLFGLNFLSKQMGRALRYNKKYAPSSKFMGFKSLLLTGNIINKDFAYYKMSTELDPFDNDVYKKSKTNFYATITNVNTGGAEYVKVIDPLAQMELLRATAAMPFVSRMVEYNDEYYLDGAIADAIPIDKMKSMNCDKIIVVTTRVKDYRKKKALKAVNKLRYHKYPKLVEALNNKPDLYNEQVEHIIDLENKKEIFVIRPSEYIKVKRIERNPKTLQSMYDLGVKDAKAKLKQLKKYLNK